MKEMKEMLRNEEIHDMINIYIYEVYTCSICIGIPWVETLKAVAFLHRFAGVGERHPTTSPRHRQLAALVAAAPSAARCCRDAAQWRSMLWRKERDDWKWRSLGYDYIILSHTWSPSCILGSIDDYSLDYLILQSGPHKRELSWWT